MTATGFNQNIGLFSLPVEKMRYRGAQAPAVTERFAGGARSPGLPKYTFVFTGRGSFNFIRQFQ